MKMITLSDITENDIRTISSWKYEGDFAIYNMNLDAKEFVRDKRKFLEANGLCQLHGVHIDGNLGAIITMREAGDEIEMGIMMDPELTGRHLGPSIMKEGVKKARVLYPQKRLMLEVAVWNVRAVKCYQKAGFIQEGEEYLINPENPKSRHIKMYYSSLSQED